MVPAMVKMGSIMGAILRKAMDRIIPAVIGNKAILAILDRAITDKAIREMKMKMATMMIIGKDVLIDIDPGRAIPHTAVTREDNFLR